MSLGVSVKEEHWDFILAIIEKRVAEYRARINEYRLENKDYTLETLVQRTENPVRSMSVGSYLDLFITQLKDENRLGYAESFKGLKSSLLLYCKSLDIKFSAIDHFHIFLLPLSLFRASNGKEGHIEHKVLLKLSSFVKFSQNFPRHDDGSNGTTSLVCTAPCRAYAYPLVWAIVLSVSKVMRRPECRIMQ